MEPRVTELELEPLYRPRPVKPARVRPKRSIWRCAAYCCLVMNVAIVSSIAYVSYPHIRNSITFELDPHRHSTTHGNPQDANNSSVVKPLIELDTKFDLVATVFMRNPDDITRPQQERDIERRTEKLRGEGWDEFEISQFEAKEEATAKHLNVDVRDVRSFPSEKMLWSGYIARDMTMNDGRIDTSVTFDLPLERL